MWRPLEWWATGGSSAGRRDTATATLTAADNVTSDRVPDPGSPVRRWLVVRVVVRPLRDLGAVRRLKDALAGVVGVESISMSGVSSYTVQFEGWFGHEREIVAELERALPFAFEVESATGDALTLRLRTAEPMPVMTAPPRLANAPSLGAT